MGAQCEYPASLAVLHLNLPLFYVKMPSAEKNFLLRENRPLSVNAVNLIKLMVYFAQIHSLISQQVYSFPSFREKLARVHFNGPMAF